AYAEAVQPKQNFHEEPKPQQAYAEAAQPQQRYYKESQSQPQQGYYEKKQSQQVYYKEPQPRQNYYNQPQAQQYYYEGSPSHPNAAPGPQQNSQNGFYTESGAEYTNAYYLPQSPGYQRRAKPFVSAALKTCKIIFFILILLEFIGVFLPLRSINIDMMKSISNETSLANMSGFFVAVAFFLLAILAVLVFFSEYIGVAIGQIIQTLIIAFISILLALTSESEFRYSVGISSNGIGFYIMLLVPICMIILSIVTLVQSLKNRSNNRRR
ncbi:MAG: hypothetical protein IKN79_02295, partial [Eubacterium sp.]|nr:hypothetical protein [Eubacterium sp.]